MAEILELEQKMKAALTGGKLPCAEAFRIARELKITNARVGEEANRLGIKIAKCQLGCFP
jgi:LAO/AO transport system kinase